MIHMMTNGLYRFCEWVTRLAYVNVLWLAFSLAGFVVFGFFPATAALFTVTRRWALGEADVPVFATFWEAFKRQFWPANKIGLLITLPLIMFGANVMIIEQYGAPFPWLPFLLTSFFLLYLIVAIFLFPVYVHYNVTLRQTVKLSLVIGLLRPFQTAVMMMSLIGLAYVMMQHVTFMLFFSGSVFSFVLMRFAVHAFIKVAEKQEQAAVQQA